MYVTPYTLVITVCFTCGQKSDTRTCAYTQIHLHPLAALTLISKFTLKNMVSKVGAVQDALKPVKSKVLLHSVWAAPTVDYTTDYDASL